MPALIQPDYHWRGQALILDIRLQPRASNNKIVGFQADGRLKVRICAPPVDGQANAALLRFLAGEFGVTATAITLLSGQHSRNKRLQIIAPAVFPAGITPKRPS